MSTQDVSVKVPRPLLDALADLGKSRDRSGAGELRQAAVAWVSTHSGQPNSPDELEDDPDVSWPAKDEPGLSANTTLYASLFGTLAALAGEHGRTIPAEIRAAIRSWVRAHAEDLARLEAEHETSYRRG